MPNNQRKLKVADLFSGAGGMSLGFQAAGFDIVAAFDRWSAAVKCYSRNLPGHAVFEQDLSDVVSVSSLLCTKDIDVIIGGPPCQDFSTAGKKIEGERASLTISFAQIVAKVRPQYFVMENVQSAKRSKAFSFARATFKSVGYGLTEIVLDASFCGVPQRRKRFFCIGILNGKDEALAETLISRQADLPRTVRDCFKGKPPMRFYYAHPRTYRRRAIFSIDEPAPTVRSGGNRPMPPDYKRHPADPVVPSTEQIRALSMEERAALQMFPSDYIWGESRLENELLISNAVPVGLAQFVGEALLAYITNPVTAPRQCFLSWLCSEKKISVKHSESILCKYRKAYSLISEPVSTDKVLLRHLERNDIFKRCSEQLKKEFVAACKLHMLFNDQTHKNLGEQTYARTN